MKLKSIGGTGSQKSIFIIVFLLVLLALLYASRHVLRARFEGPLRKIYTHIQRPDIAWEKASLIQEGFDGRRLETLQKDLEARNTDAFLVVRNNRIVYEWYAFHTGPNDRHMLAAMAKAAVAVPVVLVGLKDHRFTLDDRLSKYVPELNSDPLRSQIRIRDLLFHQSGLDDVDFIQGQRGEINGWKEEYYENPDKRFQFALFKVPMIFTPGSRESYSGVGYYALAYAVTKALQGAPESDIKTLFWKRIAEPLGIPKSDWSLSYGKSYEFGGLKLYAFGSGAKITPRAVARIGELVLEGGQWHGQKIFDSDQLDDLLGRVDIRKSNDVSNHHGFILNRNHRYTSLPPDAIFGSGSGHNILLVVPSLNLVAVRTGTELSDPGEDYDDAIENRLFRPLMESIVGPGSRPKS